jgi:hypothetical protein
MILRCKNQRVVAHLAGGSAVQSHERKVRQVVMEQDVPAPGILRVAIATLDKRTRMRIPGLVTTPAVRGKRISERSGMASRAIETRVRATEFKSRLCGVIKDNRP